MWGNCLFLAFMHQGDKTFFAYVFIDPETEISHVLSAYISFPSFHVYSPSYLQNLLFKPRLTCFAHNK